MKIAIDSGPLTSGHKVRGVGTYTSEIIKALGPKVNAVDFRKADLSKFNLVHFPYFNPFFMSFQLIHRVKTVVTIHDLIPLIYPKHYPPGIKGKIKFLIQKFLIRRVDAIITDTETSKKDICRFLRVRSEKVHVVYLAQRKIFRKLQTEELKEVKTKYKLPEKFVLYVGDINYNKNIPNLIRACNVAKIQLVIVGKQALEFESGGQEDLIMLAGPRDWIRFLLGKPHPELAHYRKLRKEFRNNSKVIRLGYLPDEDLVKVYNLATIYCQPSFYEGFGLPVLEAIACDTPVVASKTQALVEIAEGAARFVDPNDPKNIAVGFRNLIKNPKLPKEYSWEKTAKETLAVYEKI